MTLSEIEYPLRLCVELLHFSVWSCNKTENMKYSEIKELLLRFFSEDQIIKAQEILSGKSESNKPHQAIELSDRNSGNPGT